MSRSDRPFGRGRWLAFLLLLTVAVTWVWAHEGHETIPSRGVLEVRDPRTKEVVGLVLSREAREALDLQTAAVEERALEHRLLAYATLVAPWQKHAYAT